MPAKKSFVWEYFEKVDKEFVLCILCKKKLKSQSNTSNMRLHLKSRHPTVNSCERVCDSERVSESTVVDEPVASTSTASYSGKRLSETLVQPSISSNNNLVEPPKKRPRQLKLFAQNTTLSDLDKKSIDKALVKMIGVDLQPLSIVENKGFREYSFKLQPQYMLPSRKVLTNTLIPSVCNDISNEIRSKLENVEHVGVTTDIWSSDTNISFMTVTCHFIYNDEKQNVVLETREMPGSHTALSIATSLRQIFELWNIHNKVVSVTTDNGANIKSAVTDHLKITHIPCVAHTLNLCVTDAIEGNKEFKDVIKKCKTIVSHFKISNLAADKLKEIQKQMNCSVLNVKKDVPTRWNSTLIMIDRLLEIRVPLSASISCLTRAPDSLDAGDWHILEDCVKVLRPVHTMTEEMSGETYPTLSMVIPLIRSVQHAVRSTETESEVGCILQTTLLDNLSRRFLGWEKNTVVAKATFLDPRFMKSAFGLVENADKAEKLVAEELEYKKKQLLPDVNPETPNTTNSSEETNELENDKNSTKLLAKKQLWEWMDLRVEERKKSRSASTIASSALLVRHYLELEQPNRWENPLPFCSQHKHVIPEIYSLQKKYLSLPATSVPSERLFSTAGQVANDRRNRLKPKNVNNILFLHSNMK